MCRNQDGYVAHWAELTALYAGLGWDDIIGCGRVISISLGDSDSTLTTSSATGNTTVQQYFHPPTHLSINSVSFTLSGLIRSASKPNSWCPLLDYLLSSLPFSHVWNSLKGKHLLIWILQLHVRCTQVSR